MLALLVLPFIVGKIESVIKDRPRLVYDQDIYNYLFETGRDSHRDSLYKKYNKNSPPMSQDDMTRYHDSMEIFNYDIDKFVDWHCDPYISYLESKLFIIDRDLCSVSISYIDVIYRYRI